MLPYPNVRSFEPSEWAVYRELRLRGLAESPDAFGSTLAAEKERTAEQWQLRLSSGVASDSDLPLLGLVGDANAGLAWARVASSTPSEVHLFQMWVAPEYRHRGLGKLLLRTAIF